MTESIIGKVITSESVKFITGKIFKGLESKARKLNSKRTANEIIQSINSLNREKFSKKFTQHYLQFKSISSGDDDLFINEIYVELSFTDKRNKKVTNFKDVLNNEKNKRITCLTGRAGQGKTTYLRRLIWESIQQTNIPRIPVLIFLKDIKWSEFPTLISILINELSLIGFEVNTEVCFYMLKNGFFDIYFDGFDEVPTEYQSHAIEIINQCSSKFECRCIVSTRPNTRVTIGTNVRSYSINNLTESEALDLINKYQWVTAVTRKRLCDTISKNEALKKILITPIMIDIFIFLYPDLYEEPKELVDFYKQVFRITTSKHNRLKNTLKLGHLTDLSDLKLEELFSALCFRVIFDSKYVELNRFEFDSYIKFASENAAINEEDYPRLGDDLILRSCLIIEEANLVSFLHKSIVEYYAANFISLFENRQIEKFYENLRFKYRQEFELDNVVYFLSRINTSKFNRFYLAPILEGLLEELNEEIAFGVFTSITDITFEAKDEELKLKVSLNGTPFSILKLFNELQTELPDVDSEYPIELWGEIDEIYQLILGNESDLIEEYGSEFKLSLYELVHDFNIPIQEFGFIKPYHEALEIKLKELLKNATEENESNLKAHDSIDSFLGLKNSLSPQKIVG